MNVMIWTPQVVTRMNWQSLCGSPYMILRSIQTIKLKGTSIKIPIHFIIKFNPSNDNSIWNSTAGTPKSFEFQIPFDFKKKRVTKKKNIPKKTLIGALLCPHQKKNLFMSSWPKKIRNFPWPKKIRPQNVRKNLEKPRDGSEGRPPSLEFDRRQDHLLPPVVTPGPRPGCHRKPHGSEVPRVPGEEFSKKRTEQVGLCRLFNAFLLVL